LRNNEGEHAVFKVIGKVPFYRNELVIRALSGELADHQRNTSHHTSTRRNLRGELADVQLGRYRHAD
jgi:hypothetical protein